MSQGAEGDEVHDEGDGNWEEEGDGEWEGEWDDDEDWGDEEDDDYDDDDYEDDEQVVQIRPQMSGRNRMPNCGFHTIEIYSPQFYFKQIEMEEFDARPDRYGPSVIGKYTKGIGQIEARYPTDDEDPISYCMTVIHRLMERMERDGFNETYKWSEDGSTLKNWNAVGRLDVGSESLVDRSKSMKAYCMDLFERYGDGDLGNIEGVDMYNACYGGQAAGLCCQNWVESDRWDGRYGLAMATDISEAPYQVMFCVGASCTGSLYYPDAPLAHHSHRASCILHRFDFFKPVGWFHMGPVVDGKYSIDAYMNCVDTCYQTLRKKMNDRPLLQISDYNVFHTGGGYHVVKKAFERCIRAENPKTPAEERDRYVQEKLLPSCHLLKIIGPCHTVSSFLNIASVIMSQWERALGKILIVFTYGSGCASSMYQVRFDDIAWMEPLAVWKTNRFYREALYVSPDYQIHQIYIGTWMKFDFRPIGRKMFGLGYDTYQMNVYYLMEIDPWGRRFFHRGGMRAGPLPKKHVMHYDKIENRGMRKKYGDLPEGASHDRAVREQDPAQALEDRWKALEFEMTYDAELDPDGQPKIVEDRASRAIPGKQLVTVENHLPSADNLSIFKDDGDHSYQIVGTWTSMTEAEDMQKASDGSYTYVVTLGANQWEQFHLIQDGDWDKKVYPAYARSWKDLPCIGPHKGPKTPQYWLISGVVGDDLPDDDAGEPGDQYLVTFKWEKDKVKKLTWEKIDGEPDHFEDDGRYYLSGSWACWDLVELEKDPGSAGTYSLDVMLTPLKLEFQIIRNEDWMQRVYPDVDDGLGDAFTRVAPVNELGRGKNWGIDGDDGDIFRITLQRNPRDLSDITVFWDKIDHKPVVVPPSRYFLVGSPNGWGADGKFHEFVWKEAAQGYLCSVTLTAKITEFQILVNKDWDKCIHPDKRECSQIQAHEVKGPDGDNHDLNWHIGKSAADKARIGDTFLVKLELEPARKVSWKKV